MKPNFLYRMLISCYAISTFAEGVLMPIYAIFVQKIGGDILDASGAIAIFLMVSGLTTIIIHRTKWSQKHRVLLMMVGWVIWVVGIGGYFFVSDTVTLFITQIIIALGNAVANPAFDAELDDHTDESIKSYEWGLFEALQDIFNGIAALAGGLIATFFGFGSLIMVMFIAATVSCIGIIYYVQVKKRTALG